MTKQEFLAMSLPHVLKLHMSGLYNIDHTNDEKVNAITVELVGIRLREVEIHEIGRTITEFYEISDCKPIIHPLSDLTKPITHKGEAFVPIVELAKMCFSNTYGNLPNIKNHEVLNSESCESFGFIGYTDDERFSLTFNDTFCDQSFEFWIDRSRHFIKQLELFLKLIEWHFDIAGLIERGEAIDVNTLETNPYA